MITKKIDITAIHTDLRNKVSKVYQNFQLTFVSILDPNLPRKARVLRGNHKPHVDKSFC